MRILVVDDDAEERERISALATSWGHEVNTAENGVAALEHLAGSPTSLIITDLRMPKMDGMELIRQLHEQGVYTPTILLTGFGSIQIALSVVHDLGAFWFLEKPVDRKTLQVLLERVAAQGRLQMEVQVLRRELISRGVLGEMTGQSAPMQRAFALIGQLAPSNASVLITGESGTGKELAARAIHALSPRNAQPFIAINCAALPEALIESELFGHEKGAFTGAIDRRIGCLEMAHNGTLFLDEIGEMPIATQPKFLRVLEDFTFRRLGGKQEIKTDVRIVAATNRDPMKAIKDGRLREDLFYRLSVFQLELPALRDRSGDIPLLATEIIRRLNQKHGTKVTDVHAHALPLLEERSWDGNVRELRNVLERAVILAGEGSLYPQHFSFMQTRPNTTSDSNLLNVRVGFTIDEAERSLIEATLKQSGGNKTKAAAILGISTKTLYVKLKQYKLAAEETAAAAGEGRG